MRVSFGRTQPDAAAIIQGAAETHMAQPPVFTQLINSAVTAALGEERAQQLRTRGVDMDWDRALAYTLTQTTQALRESGSEAQP